VAEKKQDINPEQFNEFLTYVATKVEPTQIKDIFTGKALKETIGMFKEDNPLIKSYKLTGAGFINKLLQDKTDFNLTNSDKKLIIEVGAFGDPDPRSGFKLNMSDPKIADRVEKMSEDLVIQKQKLSNDEYQSYRANARKKLVNDILKFKVTDTVFDNEAPKLDMSERDRSKPFSDFITKELNMQSGYGFDPEIPDFAGGTVGKKYIPANDQERYRTTTISSEAYPDTTTTRDRLENFSLDKESGYLRGPEGLFYNPETEQFLQQKDVYGPAPQLQGYQYDPRLKGILSTAINPNYGSQFKEGGKTMDIKQQTKNVASQGRYGDSMLLHVNPAEVKGLAQAVPLTINPQTGQPEAFLPFLAPVLGSLAGGTLLAGATGSALLGSAIGSGLAQYAVTGDLKKGLLAGLTGYGIGSALQGAGAAAQGTEAATAAADTVTNVATDAATSKLLTDPTLINPALAGPPIEGAAGVGLNTAGQQALDLYVPEALAASQNTIAQAAKTGVGIPGTESFIPGSEQYLAADPNLRQAFTDAGGFSMEGGKNILTGLTKPGAYIPASIGMGGTSIMESQEAFENMLARNAREQEEERQRIIAENPEMIPIATGGVTKMQEGGDTDPLINPNTGDYYTFQDIMGGYYGGPDNPNNLGSYRDTGYVQKREAAPIDPYFMPGFQGEATYFNNLNPSATDITTGEAPVLDTSAGQAPSSMPRRFDPTQTVGYQNFYGDQAQDIVPQVVDPYAPVQFEQIPPPVLNQPSPFPTMPIAGPPTQLGDVVEPIPSDSDVGGGMGDIGNLVPDNTSKTLTPKAQARAAFTEENVDVSNYVSPNLQNMPPLDFSNLPPVDLNNLQMQDFQRNLDFDFRAEGKQTDIEVDKLPEGLKKMYESGPEGKEGVAKIAAKTAKFEAGGPTEIMQDPLTAQLIQFLMGEVQDDTIVGDFINKYGNEVFMQVREQVLQSIVPGSQTQGQIQGMANGGMRDDVTGMIGSTQPVAVSQDEYIIPADAMSMLGDGSSDAGAKKLDAMLDRIRMAKTGTTKQAKEINDSKVMPA